MAFAQILDRWDGAVTMDPTLYQGAPEIVPEPQPKTPTADAFAQDLLFRKQTFSDAKDQLMNVGGLNHTAALDALNQLQREIAATNDQQGTGLGLNEQAKLVQQSADLLAKQLFERTGTPGNQPLPATSGLDILGSGLGLSELLIIGFLIAVLGFLAWFVFQ